MLRIGKTIKRIRERRALTQQQLADEIGVTANFLSLVENEHRRPSSALIEQVAGALDVPTEVLLWDAVDVPEGFGAEDRTVCEAAKQVVASFIERNVGPATDADMRRN